MPNILTASQSNQAQQRTKFQSPTPNRVYPIDFIVQSQKTVPPALPKQIHPSPAPNLEPPHHLITMYGGLREADHVAICHVGDGVGGVDDLSLWQGWDRVMR
jgi:hypothetical protein